MLFKKNTLVVLLLFNLSLILSSQVHGLKLLGGVDPQGDSITEIDLLGETGADLLAGILGMLTDKDGNMIGSSIRVNNGNKGDVQAFFGGEPTPLNYKISRTSAFVSSKGLLLRNFAPAFRANRHNNDRFVLLDKFGNSIPGSESAKTEGAKHSEGDVVWYISYSNDGQIITDTVLNPTSIIQGALKTVIAKIKITVGSIFNIAGANPTYTFAGGAATKDVIANDGTTVLGTLSIRRNKIDYQPNRKLGRVDDFEIQVTDGTSNSAIAFFNIENIIDDDIIFSQGSIAIANTFVDNGRSSARTLGASVSVAENRGGDLIKISNLKSGVTYSLDAASKAAGFSLLDTGVIRVSSLNFEASPFGSNNEIVIVVETEVVGGILFAREEITITLIDVNDIPTGLPTISGETIIGSVLTADISAIMDQDGVPGNPSSFTYQWQRNGVNILSGARNKTYTLVTADEGRGITVIVRYTDAKRNREAVTSIVTRIPRNITFNEESVAVSFVDNFGRTPPALGASVTIAENTSGLLVGINSVFNGIYSLDAASEAAGFSLANGIISAPNLDFEESPLGEDNEITLTISLSKGGITSSEDVVVTLRDINEAPEIDLKDKRSVLFVGTNLDKIQVATIDVMDDALGENMIDIIGRDANSFRVEANKLFLRAGTVITLDTELKITLRVMDTTTTPTFEDTVKFTLRGADNVAELFLLDDSIKKSSIENTILVGLQTLLTTTTDVTRTTADAKALIDLVEKSKGTIKERQDIIAELVPEIHGKIASAVEGSIKDIVANTASRTLAQTRTGFSVVNGPDTQESSQNIKEGNFWYDFTYSTGTRDSNLNISGYDSDGYSIRVGYERAYSEVFIGGTVSYSNNNIINDNNDGGTADISTVAIGLYGNYQKDQRFYTSTVLLAFSDIEASHKRKVLGNLDGNTDAFTFDLSFVYGVIKHYVDRDFTLLTGLRYSNTSISDIEESGGGLSVNSNSADYDGLYLKFGATANFNVTEDINKKEDIVLFVDYNINLLDVSRNISSQFTTGGDSFEVSGIDEDSSSIAFGTAYRYNSNGVLFELGYNYRFSSISSTNNFTAKIKHSF